MSRSRWDHLPKSLEGRVALPSHSILHDVRYAKPPKVEPKKHGVQLNKTEAAYLLYLKHALPEGAAIFSQAIKFRLADDCFYLPDFVVFFEDAEGKWQEVREVKGGFVREDSLIKFKVAREMYPQFKWKMIRKTKDGWQEIYP